MNPSSFVKDIGRSFFVSSFLPAALFVSVGILILQDFLPKIAVDRMVSSPYLFGSEWFISLLLIAWASFTLYSILPWTLRLYEGYFFPKFIQDWITSLTSRFWHNRRTKNIQKLKGLKKDVEKDTSHIERQEHIREFGKCRQNALNEFTNLEPFCPIEPNLLSPTRLGNLMKSCMYYPKRRYNIDGNLLWPRLKSILPKEFLEEKDDSEARLIFMLNSSLLSYVISTLSLAGGLIGISCSGTFVQNNCSNEFYKQAYMTISPIGFLIIGALFVVFGYLLYQLAVSAGETFSSYVRTGFDLYRFDLLKKLNLETPKSIEEEQDLWSTVNELFAAGNELGLIPLKIKYNTEK